MATRTPRPPRPEMEMMIQRCFLYKKCPKKCWKKSQIQRFNLSWFYWEMSFSSLSLYIYSVRVCYRFILCRRQMEWSKIGGSLGRFTHGIHKKERSTTLFHGTCPVDQRFFLNLQHAEFSRTHSNLSYPPRDSHDFSSLFAVSHPSWQTKTNEPENPAGEPEGNGNPNGNPNVMWVEKPFLNGLMTIPQHGHMVYQCISSNFWL